jgi:copper transport protein
VGLAPALLAPALALLALVLAAAPAEAHADLVSTRPANGQRLDQAPRAVVLRFSERVSVVEGAFRLVDQSTGERVRTTAPQESADGTTVRLPVPSDLRDGSYLVTWRVLSADAHPVGGASSFGVGQDAAPASAATVASAAPWGIPAARAVGYTAFAAVAGALVLALLWPEGRHDRRLRRLRSTGTVVGVLASVALLLLQGPYVAGVPVRRLLDPEVMAAAAHGSFGTWVHLRVLLYLFVAGVLWLPEALDQASSRWLAALAVVGVAVTFPGTGHAGAAGDLLAPAADAVHALATGVWVGGLLAFVVLARVRGPRPGAEVFARFSRLALGAVVCLVATGTLAAVRELGAWSDFWETGYGQLLAVKLLLVAAVLGSAYGARRTVRAGGSPWAQVRQEAVGTVTVLALTAALGVTPPPDHATEAPADAPAVPARVDGSP